jgi:hypothetical protein
VERAEDALARTPSAVDARTPSEVARRGGIARLTYVVPIAAPGLARVGGAHGFRATAGDPESQHHCQIPPRAHVSGLYRFPNSAASARCAC